MFRALTCPSSGGQIVLSQHMVSYGTICCDNTICPREDGHVNARKHVEDYSVTNILLMNKGILN